MSQTTFDVRDIMALLAHRYPFLLVDRVTHYEPHKTLTAIKNVTFNEPFFPGHFPRVPTMPGVLMLEAMAQACGVHACRDTGLGHESGLILYLAGIDHARFRRPVVPGDQLVIRVERVKRRRSLWVYKGTAHVGNELACSAELMCMLKAPPKNFGSAKATPEERSE